MKQILSVLAMLAFVGVQSQNWCPPGAEWVFRPDPSEVMTQGYSHLKYAGDTVVGGRQAKRLSKDYAYINWSLSGVTSSSAFYPDAYITHEENGVVSLWHPIMQVWDTLYWFSGEIGDRWEEIYYPGEGWY